MTSRILPPAEWARLAGTEAETVWPHLNPAQTSIIVVEDGDRIVGCQVLMTVLHAECLWIHPDHRGKSSVARRLWSRVQQTARNVYDAQTLVTSSLDESIDTLLAHVGAVRVPGAMYALRVKE